MRNKIYKILDANLDASDRELKNASKAVAGLFTIELRTFAEDLWEAISDDPTHEELTTFVYKRLEIKK